jgi:hypothetical protein
MADILTRFGVTYAEVPSPQTLTDGTGDSLANDLVLQDEENTLALEVTAEQYMRLLSAALDGANRHWPDSYIAVIYPLIKAAKVSNALCEAVAECINDPESDTYAALHDFLLSQIQNNAEISNAIAGVGNTDGTAVAGVTDALAAECDLDILFGFCRQVVQLMNLEVTKFFEVLEVISNNVEFASYVGDKAPALGTLATFVSYLQNTLVESYLANYDIDYENDLACELFCFAKDQPSCELNWFNITDIMADRVGEDLTNLSLSSMLTYVLSGGWSGDEFCDAAIFVFAFVMQIGVAWTGISFAKIQQIVQSFFNDPDADWQTLCGCGWYEEISIGTSTPDNWSLDWGYDIPSQVGSITYGTDGNTSYKIYTTLAARKITQLDVTCSQNAPTPTRTVYAEIEASGVVKETLSWVLSSSEATQYHTFDFSYAGSDIDKVTVRGVANTNPAGPGYTNIYEMTVYGEGSNPYS